MKEFEERDAAMPHPNHENENIAVVVPLRDKFGLPTTAANFVGLQNAQAANTFSKFY